MQKQWSFLPSRRVAITLKRTACGAELVEASLVAARQWRGGDYLPKTLSRLFGHVAEGLGFHSEGLPGPRMAPPRRPGTRLRVSLKRVVRPSPLAPFARTGCVWGGACPPLTPLAAVSESANDMWLSATSWMVAAGLALLRNNAAVWSLCPSQPDWAGSQELGPWAGICGYNRCLRRHDVNGDRRCSLGLLPSAADEKRWRGGSQGCACDTRIAEQTRALQVPQGAAPEQPHRQGTWMGTDALSARDSHQALLVD